MTTLTNHNNKQLFTDLTSEEAAVVEGGKKIILHKVEAIKSAADGFKNSDDLYIKLGKKTVWGPRSIDNGDIKNLGISRNFSKFLKVSLWDEDIRNDDPLGSFTAKNRTSGKKTRILKGSDSKYELTYSVV